MELIKLQYNVSVSFGIIFCSSALHLLQMLMFTRGSPFDELLAVICWWTVEGKLHSGMDGLPYESCNVSGGSLVD
jgi:hypothetical protein